MLSHGIPWNMPLVFSSYIHTHLKARVYTENTSDAWHIPWYPTQKHCITSIYYIEFNIYMYIQYTCIQLFKKRLS